MPFHVPDPDPTATWLSHSLTASMLTVDGTRPVDMELRYDASCPYAVTATFYESGVPVSWTFARDLLQLGLHEPVGAGDVHIRPDLDDYGQAAVLVELRSPEGVALALLPAREVGAFVDGAVEVVRPGFESHHLDIDAELRELLLDETGAEG
ncbi:MAG TPA: SsgA family sporulation/cell division regulator [Nocardioidaceae bacterium]|nr:SsgA family sporulation/cell division regulator [Nocardioidaceae bacterium]